MAPTSGMGLEKVNIKALAGWMTPSSRALGFKIQQLDGYFGSLLL